MAGRTGGPASRPPRRGSAARTPTSAASARAGSGRSGAGRGGTGARTSAARGASAPRASAASRTTSDGAGKVVRRTRSGWPGAVGNAVTHRFVRRGVVLAGVLVFLTVLLGSSVAAWFHQRGEIAALQERVATQEADVAALRAERERWNDPAYVEQQARERLKFVRPGERSYTVLDPQPDSAVAATTVGPGADEDAPARPWYSTAWESVLTADAPGARR